MLFETVGRFYRPSRLAPSFPTGGEGESALKMAEAGDTDRGRPACHRRPRHQGRPGPRGRQPEAVSEAAPPVRRAARPGRRADLRRAGAGDTALAERLAHTLKGVAGNIGAKPVQAAAGALEKAHPRPRPRRAKSTRPSAGWPLLSIRCSRNCGPRWLCAATPSPAQLPPTAPPDPAQTREAAAQLAKLLSEFDPGAAEFIEANQAALRPLFPGEAWAQFEKLVQGYAFADAQAQLEQALKT